jgi:hypothetical protein
MILFASAGFSVRDAQAGENRGGIAAHKYAGLTIFQRTIPRARKTTAKPQSAEILPLRSKIWISGMGQKRAGEEIIFH